MKKDEKFTKDQVRDFERRVGRTYSLRFLVGMIQEYLNDRKRIGERYWRDKNEAKEKIRQLQAKIEEYEQAEQRLIAEFEIKSYEYGIYSGEITPSETNETNETNQSCLPLKEQGEPLEVIDLDEIYKEQVVEIKTNG